ncbi:PAS domain S-box protein [Halostella sp. JP-L12]|uniref:PAS domain S-box protein n=1 Tax=Halostella TaxID=1843185 RepID=UPI0013CEFBEB|nr:MULTISPECIES: PAS domain S-box protein [Halostella]NHN49763.1 PAS domain S-box protein [Halostella sp. JP-L12]NHN49900.1 PAS domain S-box protein [Halostella sp. JP-L12]
MSEPKSAEQGDSAVSVAEPIAVSGAETYFRSVVENTSDGVVGVDESGDVVVANPAVERLFGYAPEELIGEPVTALMPERLQSDHVAAFERYLSTGERTVDWDYLEFPGQHRDGHELQLSIAFRESEHGGERVFTGFIRDVTPRKERERELERQRDELERLNRINGVIRDINRSLVGAADRDAMLTAVCEHLAAADRYRSAWIGERDPATDRLQPTAWAGIELSEIDRASASAGDSDNPDPVAAAARTRESQVKNGVAAVPIVYDGTPYGALAIRGEQPGLFDERERSVLTELGETVGYAINALEQRRMIMSDARLEVTLRVNDAIDECNALVGRELAVLRTVAGKGDRVVIFVSTDPDVEAADLTAAFGDVVTVENVRRVRDGLFEVVAEDLPVTRALSGRGGRLRSASIEGTSMHFVTELPQDADVRALVETVREAFPDTRLVAQRSVTRDERSVEEFRATADAEVTEKQRTALEAAYFGGYFDRPRESTGEELAASLGVSPSTFHQHLQAGLRKSLAALFEQ